MTGNRFQQTDQGTSQPRDYHDLSVVLIGLMGTGKSTIGKRLAEQLGLPFYDADEEIEKASALSISEIFEKFGEDYFRDGERRVLARLVSGSRCVIATGGGAFMHPDSRRLILENALAVWLDAEIDILVDRVKRRDTRPLLKNRDPKQALEELAAKRNPVYALAPIHIRSDSAPHHNTVKAIMKVLNEWKP